MGNLTEIVRWGMNLLLSPQLCLCTPFCAPVFLVGFFFLPLRHFLNMADLKRRTWGGISGESAFPRVGIQLHTLARSHLHQVPPPLLISNETRLRACAFGTFRRRYLVLSHSLAAMLEEWFASEEPASIARGKALLLHELAHMAQRDIWIVLGLYSLLRAAILIVGIEFGFLCLVLTLGTRLTEFLGAHIRIAVLLTHDVADGLLPAQGHCNNLPLTLVFYGLVAGGSLIGLLWLCCTCSRHRELAADRRVIQWQGTAQPLWAALLIYSVHDTVKPRGAMRTKCHITWGNIQRWFRDAFSFHPSLDTRLAQLRDTDALRAADIKRRSRVVLE